MPNKWFCFRGKRKGYILRRDIVHRSICWFASSAICSFLSRCLRIYFSGSKKTLLVHFYELKQVYRKCIKSDMNLLVSQISEHVARSLSENFRHKTQCQRDVNHGSRKFFFLLSFRHKTKPRRSRQCSKYISRKHGCSFFAFRFVGFIIQSTLAFLRIFCSISSLDPTADSKGDGRTVFSIEYSQLILQLLPRKC